MSHYAIGVRLYASAKAHDMQLFFKRAGERNYYVVCSISHLANLMGSVGRGPRPSGGIGLIGFFLADFRFLLISSL